MANENPIILSALAEQGTSAVLEQREKTALRKAGFDPERVTIAPREGTIRKAVQATNPDVIHFAPKGSKAPPRDPEGQFAPKVNHKAAFEAALAKGAAKAQDPATEEVKAEEPAASTAAPTEADAAPVEANKALEDAKSALKLFAGYDESDLEGLSDEKVIQLGVKAHAKTVEIAKRLERDAKAAKEPTAPAKVQEAIVQIDPTDDLIAKAAKGFSEKYEGEFGQEIAEFGQAIKKAASAEVGALQSKLAAYEAQVETVLFRDAVSTLRERFPQVDQPENGTLLRAKMDELSNSKPYPDHLALAEDAALLLFGKVAIETARANAEAKSEAKRSGQPLTSARDAVARPRTPQEVFNAQLSAAVRGADRDELRSMRG